MVMKLAAAAVGLVSVTSAEVHASEDYRAQHAQCLKLIHEHQLI